MSIHFDHKGTAFVLVYEDGALLGFKESGFAIRAQNLDKVEFYKDQNAAEADKDWVKTRFNINLDVMLINVSLSRSIADDLDA